MKLLIMLLCMMFIPSCQPAIAETSLAIKEGYLFFDNNGKSEYEGNTVMDNELSNGGYVRLVKGKMIYRLDIDSFKTGNTFSKSIPIAYEKVDFKSKPIVLSIGRYLYKSLYAMAGAGYMFNNMTVEQYAAHPFDYDIKNSICLTATLGYDYRINKHLYLFTEARYLYSKADVYIQGNKNHKEDLSNLGAFIGIGLVF